jgi:hypothetical protein
MSTRKIPGARRVKFGNRLALISPSGGNGGICTLLSAVLHQFCFRAGKVDQNNGAEMMQFHSGSTSMETLREHNFLSFWSSRSYWPEMTGEAATSQEKSDAKDQQG